MTQKAVESIIGKIVLDAGFRDALLAAPDQALADFDLTETEKVSLKRLDAETMEALASTLVVRVSKWQARTGFTNHSPSSQNG